MYITSLPAFASGTNHLCVAASVRQAAPSYDSTPPSTAAASAAPRASHAGRASGRSGGDETAGLWAVREEEEGGSRAGRPQGVLVLSAVLVLVVCSARLG